jgi:putative redox protein
MRQTQLPGPGLADAAQAEAVHSMAAETDPVPTEHDVVRTTCGRLLTIGQLNLAAAAHPTTRVTLSVGCQEHDRGQVWMSLTSDESRRLARYLLARADAADRESAATHAPTAKLDATPDVPPGRALPAGRIEVTFLAGQTYDLRIRGHHLLTDQPVADGGHDIAATPTELLVGSLASCVAFYAGRYLERHGFGRGGLRVTAEFAMARQPTRVGSVRLRVHVPAELPPERARALRAFAARCTVHNTLHHQPAIDFDFV